MSCGTFTMMETDTKKKVWLWDHLGDYIDIKNESKKCLTVELSFIEKKCAESFNNFL